MKLSVDQTLHRAKSHENNGEIDAARKLYKSVLQAFPRNKRANQALANLDRLRRENSRKSPSQAAVKQLVSLFNQGRLELLAKRSKALTRDFPNSFLLWNLFGAANNGLGRLDLAVSGFQKACALNPNFPDAYNNLGVTLNAQGKYDEALANFNRAIELKPDYAEAYYNQGISHLRKGGLDDAVTSFARAVEVKPTYAEAHNELAATLQAQCKLDEAVASFMRALEIKPDYAQAHYNLGTTLHDQGKLAAALASYERAIEIKPDFGRAYFSCAKFPTGVLPDDLLANLEKFRADGDNERDISRVQFFQANILRHQGKIDQSFKMLEVANKTSESEAEIRLLRSKTRNASDEIARWSPSPVKRNADRKLKILFILGPSRSGKSTIEAALGKCEGVRLGFEGWRGEAAASYLKSLNETRLRANKSKMPAAKIEKVFFYSENELRADGVRLLTCTNPISIAAAHYFYEAFDNAYFLFVQRDEYVTASEIFAKEYRKGNFYSYNAKFALEYVRWYNDLASELVAKMPLRAVNAKYEEFLEDQSRLFSLVERLLGIELSPKEKTFSTPKRPRSGEYLDHYKKHLNEFD